MNKAKIFILIIIIAVVIAAVVLAIVIVPPKIGPDKNQKGAGETTKVEIAKEIYGFSAEIKKIEGKTLFLDASIPSADATKTPTKISVRVLVNDATKIVKIKFPTEIKDKTKPVYPEETPLEFNDLKVGDKIDVAAATNISDNIKNSTEFTLTNIFLIEK